MNPGMNLPCLMEQNSESSQDEESRPVPSTLKTDSTSTIHSPSTVDSTSPMPWTTSNLGIFPGPSTSSVPRMIPTQMSVIYPTPQRQLNPPCTPLPPIHPMPLVYPMMSVPSTSRDIQENNDFRFEAARRLSFRNWPVPKINPESFVTAGFYYTGKTDRVRCFECQLELTHWSLIHTPMQIHQLWSPQCRFVRNENCGNVPIGEDPDKVLGTEEKSIKISCPYGLQYPESFNYDHLLLKIVRKPTAYEFSRLGLTKVKKPDNSKFATYESRLKTFGTWPTLMTQKSEELADAGFFYTGIRDFTICYHCGLHAGNWIPGEDPWKRHAISSPRCYYLLIIRGREYINIVTGQELYESSTPAPIETTVGNHETPNNENGSNEMSLVQKVAALKEEIRELKDARSCKVCTEREATITFLPCGHLATCNYCSPVFARCIICRRQIKAVTRIFLP